MGLIKTFKPGGQPIINGLMIRGRNKYSIALRKSSGNILLDYHNADFKSSKLPIPFIRGIISAIECTILNIKSFLFSATYFDNEEVSIGDSMMMGSRADVLSAQDRIKAEESQKWLIFSFAVISILLLTVGFFILPIFVASMFFNNVEEYIMFNITEAITRIILFIIYLTIFKCLGGKVKTFREFHAAEHKAINCYEAGKELDIENVKKCSSVNPRSGINVLCYTILISSIALIFFNSANLLISLLIRIGIVLLSAGLAYEISRFFGMFNGKFSRAIAFIFGMWAELFTVSTPNDIQIFIALTAVKTAMEVDE